METVQGGVPPYGVKETLVVNGGKYQKTKSLTIYAGAFLFTSFLDNVLWFMRSKALDASKKHK